MSEVKRALALGFFDGIHIGHAALMRKLVEVSSEKRLSPAVITFDTMPQSFLGKKTIPLINSPEDRIGLIQRIYNINEVVFLHFNNVLASMPWDDFADKLIADYTARHLIAGHNFRFGSGAEGNCESLKQKCEDSGIACDIIPDVVREGIVSSSTYIRELLLSGDIERANDFLGHPHVLTDIVRSGQGLGSNFGTPTLNMRFARDVLIPAHGVYATRVYLGGSASVEPVNNSGGLIGVTNIGVRPTVDTSGLVTAETHIPNFRQNLYGHKVRIEFYKYLRPEMKFESTEELKAQIRRDCEAAIDFFAVNDELK